jgi:transcriptional regulator with XRE-family HTH domain
MRFKDVLRELRTKAGLTQQQLAEKAGIPLSSLRGHEQGQRIPSWASVVKLARALGVSTDTFSHCEDIGQADAPPAKKPAAGPRRQRRTP